MDALSAGPRPASSRAAVLLGALALGLLGCSCPLALIAHQFTFVNVGATLPASAAFTVVGTVVARGQPRNPIGWLLLGFGLAIPLCFDAGMYALLRYGLGHTGLPFGPLAVILSPDWLPAVVLLPLPIALFPDGRMPSRFWRATLWFYGALMTLWVGIQAALEVDGLLVRRIRVDSSGNAITLDHATGVWGTLYRVGNVLLVPYLAISVSWVGRQIVVYHRASGERKQQLKLLMSGGAASVLGLIAAFGFLGNALSDVGVVALAALPISMGVAILRYRLYDIDRLISRTLVHAILTGLLVGVFVGIVVLATDVLPFSSPVAVAASTLAAAALFNPLRLRVQRLVDRRFNRARYDAEAIVAAFSSRLREAVDLDTVRHELASAVERAVQPTHASVWIPPTAPRSRP